MLRGYQRSWLRGDLIAGVTVAAYLVPQVMAYADVTGLPPVTGLWTALPALACYAVLGSSRLVPLGPESTTALMTAVAIGLAAGAHTQLLRANPVNRTKGARGAAQTRHIQNGAATAD